MLGRNKRTVTCQLGTERGQELFARLAAGADVVVENFRPGTLERWNLGYERLSAENPGLVLLRVTGFGQFGPISHRAGFGTLAESMSGFAHITGLPDGPPTLPPFGLADGVAALASAIAALTALRARDRDWPRAGGRRGDHRAADDDPRRAADGLRPAGHRPAAHGQPLGQQRPAQHLPHARRPLAGGLHQRAEHRRARHAAGRAPGADRASSGSRPAAGGPSTPTSWTTRWAAGSPSATPAEVVEAFEQAHAAIAPIYDVADIMEDPQYRALDSITTVDDPDLGPLKMQNVLFRLVADAGRDPLERPRAGRRQRRRSTASSGWARTSWRSCARRASI